MILFFGGKMHTKQITKWASFLALAILLGSSAKADIYTPPESLEVASLLIRLSRSISNALDRPEIGAERIVSKAIISDEGNSRIHYIEGYDVSSSGRIISTYWLRVKTPLSSHEGMVMDGGMNEEANELAPGRAVPEETRRLIELLLNSLHEIADFNLDHSRVRLEEVIESSSDPLTVEIVGVNDVCDHEHFNRFKLTVIRHEQENQPYYETRLEHPFNWEV